MPKNLSSRDVAWILNQIGIQLARRGKEDIFEGEYGGRNRVVVVPLPQGTLGSIWRQAGINRNIAEQVWNRR